MSNSETPTRQFTSLFVEENLNSSLQWNTLSNNVFQDAARENKIIMLVVGSYTSTQTKVFIETILGDSKVSELIQESFIPVVADKYEAPTIDGYAQLFLTISNKAPNLYPSVMFISAEGEIFYCGSIFSKEENKLFPSFYSILEGIAGLAEKTPEKINEIFSVFQKGLEQFIISPDSSTEINLDYDSIRESVLEKIKPVIKIDTFGTNTLIQPSYFSHLDFLLDFYDKSPEVKSYLHRTVDNMINGVLYDKVNGGFFNSYSLDSPGVDYEKTLINNSLIISFLSKMYDKTKEQKYLYVAKKSADFLLSEFLSDYGMITAFGGLPHGEIYGSDFGYYYNITPKFLNDIFNKDELESFYREISIDTNLLVFKDSIDYEGLVKSEHLLEKLKGAIDSNSVELRKDSTVIAEHNFIACAALLDLYQSTSLEYYYTQALRLYQKCLYIFQQGDLPLRAFDGNVCLNATYLNDSAALLFVTMEFFKLTNEQKFLQIAEKLIINIDKKFISENGIFLDDSKLYTDTFDSLYPSPTSLIYNNFSENNKLLKFSKNMKVIYDSRVSKFPELYPSLFSL